MFQTFVQISEESQRFNSQDGVIIPVKIDKWSSQLGNASLVVITGLGIWAHLVLSEVPKDWYKYARPDTSAMTLKEIDIVILTDRGKWPISWEEIQ